MEPHRLGTLLLENPLVREDDLDRCLEIQRLAGGSRSLAEILVDEGVVSVEMLRLLAGGDGRKVVAPPPAVACDPESLVRLASVRGADELIVSAGRCVYVRIGGDLQPLTAAPMAAEEVERFVSTHFGSDSLRALSIDRSFAGDFSWPGIGRGRLAAFRHVDGIAAVLRLHPEEIRAAADCGVGARVIDAVGKSQGLVLLAGERRSGMTETMAVLIAQAARDPDRLIVVVDDHLEYGEDEHAASMIWRRVGEHTRDFSSGVRSAIGQDPDVVVVGDASPPEVFDLCLRTAQAGRLVIAGVSGRSVTAALGRSLSAYHGAAEFRVRETLASVLHCALAVRLVPSTTAGEQVVAGEELIVAENVREVLRSGELAQLDLLLRLDGEHCGHSFDHSLCELLAAGRIDFEQAFRCAEDKALLLAMTESTDVRSH